MKKIFSLLFITCCSVILFSSCEKDFSVENGNAQIAAGSLWDSSGDCLPDTVIGTFYNGITPGRDTAYVEVQVDVTETGSYKISTDFQNGFEFSDSGFFTTKGINIIRLKPIGTPTLLKPTIFNVSFDTSFCSFTIDVHDSTGTGIHSGGQDTTGQGGDPDAGSGIWQFATDSGAFDHGTFDSVVFEPDTVFGGTDLLMTGYTPEGDSAIVLVVLFTGNEITPGTYYTKIIGSDTHSNAIFAFGPKIGDAVYDALSDQDVPSNVAVTISSYNATTHVVTGTFSGIAANEKYENSTIGIVNGSFTATVSP